MKMSKTGLRVNGVLFRIIKLKNLVPFHANRFKNNPRIKRLKRDWDWIKAGVPVVQLIPGGKGKATLADWHHRNAACRLAMQGTTDKDGKEIEVLCIVLDANVDICDFHCDINDPAKGKGNTRRDLFYTRYKCNKMPERFIFNRMKEVGVECVFEGSYSDKNASLGVCYAPDKLLGLYTQIGRNDFRSIITAMLDVWGEPDNKTIEATAMRSDFIVGLTQYLAMTHLTISEVIAALVTAKATYDNFRSEDIWQWAKDEYMDAGNGHSRAAGVCLELSDLLDGLQVKKKKKAA